LRESTGSVADVSSRGETNPAPCRRRSVPVLSATKPLFAYCVDAHCGCAACLAKCDADADLGRIPLNGTWWFNQRKFVVAHGAGARVQGFFAEVAR